MAITCLLDTCALLYLVQGRPLSKASQAAIRDARAKGTLGLSVVTAWELGLLSGPDRKYPLTLLPTPRLFVKAAFASPGVVTVGLTAEIAFEASHLAGVIHKDPGDRLLIATARAHNVALITDDEKILSYAQADHLKALAC